MTYNFDPDRWFEMQREALEARRLREGMDGASYREALEELERRYEEMVRRLDGTFSLPR